MYICMYIYIYVYRHRCEEPLGLQWCLSGGHELSNYTALYSVFVVSVETRLVFCHYHNDNNVKCRQIA